MKLLGDMGKKKKKKKKKKKLGHKRGRVCDLLEEANKEMSLQLCTFDLINKKLYSGEATLHFHHLFLTVHSIALLISCLLFYYSIAFLYC